jgi:hypothetical protein
MRLSTMVTAAAVAVVAQAAYAADSYLCITDAAAFLMFDKNTKKWGGFAGDAKNQKYEVKQSSGASDQWEVTYLEDNGPTEAIYTCEHGFRSVPDYLTTPTKSIRLECVGKAGETFKLDKKSMRFIAVIPLGFADGEHAPTIFTGKCSPL